MEPSHVVPWPTQDLEDASDQLLEGELSALTCLHSPELHPERFNPQALKQIKKVVPSFLLLRGFNLNRS